MWEFREKLIVVNLKDYHNELYHGRKLVIIKIHKLFVCDFLYSILSCFMFSFLVSTFVYYVN